MDKNYLDVNNLKVSKELFEFVNDELLENTGIKTESFWSGFDEAVHELAPKNRELLNKFRDSIVIDYMKNLKAN